LTRAKSLSANAQRVKTKDRPVGDAVPRMAAIFDAYWNSPRVYPLTTFEQSREAPSGLQQEFERLTADAISAYPQLPADKPDLLGYLPVSVDIRDPPIRMLPGTIDVFADNPEKVSGRSEHGDDKTTVTARVIKTIDETQSELMLGSPYFVPGELGMAVLCRTRARGVQVVVMTNSLASNDEPLASAAYGRYRIPMLKAGVSLYETDSDQLKKDPFIGRALGHSIGRSHSKLIVLDRQLVFVGSLHLDLRSSRVNTELGMLVQSHELADMVVRLTDRVREGSYRLRLTEPGDHIQWVATAHGVETTFDNEPGVALTTRLKLLLLSPLVSESLL